MPVDSIAPFLAVVFLCFSIQKLPEIFQSDLTASRNNMYQKSCVCQICTVAARLKSSPLSAREFIRVFLAFIYLNHKYLNYFTFYLRRRISEMKCANSTQEWKSAHAKPEDKTTANPCGQERGLTPAGVGSRNWCLTRMQAVCFREGMKTTTSHRHQDPMLFQQHS